MRCGDVAASHGTPPDRSAPFAVSLIVATLIRGTIVSTWQAICVHEAEG
jgi:hypothetical protein